METSRSSQMSRTSIFDHRARRTSSSSTEAVTEEQQSRELRLVSRRGWSNLPTSLSNTITAFNSLFQVTSTAAGVSNQNLLSAFETPFANSSNAAELAGREWQPQRRIQATQGSHRSKTVYKIFCGFCSSAVCNRGMRAILLADLKVELFSTDSPPHKRYASASQFQGFNLLMRTTQLPLVVVR